MYALEGQAAYRFLFRGDAVPLRREEAFTSLPDHLGDGFLDFPEGWRPADVDEFVAMHRTSPACSVRWLVDHQEARTVRAGHASIATYADRMDAQRAAQRAALGRATPDGKVSRDTFVHDERVALFNQYVLPAMTNAALVDQGPAGLLEFMREFRAQYGNGSARRLREVFRAAAPSLELLAQIFGRRSLDSQRKTKPQDFWDTEHAALAPVYADAFVTADGGLNEVLRLGQRRPPGAKAVLLRSVDDLHGWLEQLEARE